MTNRKKINRLLMVIAAIVIVALLPPASRIDPETILHITSENIFMSALVVIGIFCIKNVLVAIPLTGLYIVCGMLFGSVWGIIVAYIGLTFEISIGFFIGRKLGKERIQPLVQKSPKAEAFYDILTQNLQTSCFIARLIPLPLPTDVVSMFFGASGFSFGSYLVFSLLGLSGSMLPYVVAGRAIMNPLSPEFLVPILIGVTISTTAFLLHRTYRKRRSNRSNAG